MVRSLDTEPGGGYRLEETKTRNSRRVVKLLSSLLSALLENRQAQQRQRDEAGERRREEGFVFTNELGGPLKRHNLAHRYFRKFLEEAALPQIGFYDLRHTAATPALAGGVAVKVVSGILGHSSVALTLDVYSHVWPHVPRGRGAADGGAAGGHRRRLGRHTAHYTHVRPDPEGECQARD